ncbi:MAG: hypothetical protein ACFFCS_07875, partial [Candidatus Hodarchaeota archaeon]
SGANGTANLTSGIYNATGISGSGSERLILHSPFPALSNWTRTYIKLNISINNTNINKSVLQFRRNNELYETNITLTTGFTVIRKTFPYDFNKTVDPGNNEILIQIQGDAAGFDQGYSLLVESMVFSRWGHYTEDYKAHYNATDGYWYNNPPFTKATDKNVSYDGSINDTLGPIPAYGNYTHQYNELRGENIDAFIPAGDWYLGIYDSMDPVVIESQLRLMHWAGIDVVMLMHPDYFHVAETIMDVAWDIKQRFINNSSDFNLKFVYYDGWYKMVDLLNEIKNYEHYDDLYLKVTISGTEIPVFWVGYTGLLEEPYANYKEEFNAIRKSHDVFMVADGWLPPKEEMLGFFDGYYFYDTSSLMRQGYGDPRIAVYQQDGSVSYGYGKLEELFTATSNMVHAHGLIYASTVIPGIDNTCVHDFLGRPLADTRPGTIVDRTGGLVFNTTWEASMAAGADWITITSWNELHEGTEIEPTAEEGTFYIELCKEWAATFKA